MFKRVEDIEEVVYNMMDQGKTSFTLYNEYHIDGDSDVIIQDIVLKEKDEIIMTRTISKITETTDKEVQNEIDELNELANSL